MSTLRRKLNGFTLIELLVTVTVLSIALGIAVGAFGNMLERQRLESAAGSLYDSLTLARTESITRNGNIYVSVVTGSSWCHGLDDTAACSCSTTDDCQIDTITKTTDSAVYNKITLSSATNSQFRYNSRRGMPETTTGGTLSASTFTFTSASGDSLSVSLSPVGRLRMCTSSGLRGYPSC